ncbi:MAG TPA: DUF1638 domain-containing protein [Acidimicrobiales bacterium]|nr:DUF1638 domain-containing protein [Acidimicrobiales bacterium]
MTDSSSGCHSLNDAYARATSRPLAVIACGALSSRVRAIVASLPRTVEVHTLSAALHNRPADITPAVESLCRTLMEEGKQVLLAYADCGTYGALDSLCQRLGIPRLPGLHCYDMLAGEDGVRRIFEQEPGTYLLTDFLVRCFDRLVVEELGIDRHPDLVADYFSGYRRVLWLAERPDATLERGAREIAARLGLPLEIQCVGTRNLDGRLRQLLDNPMIG